MATTISGTSITYNDGTVQTRAANAGGVTLFQSPGTFAIPSTTTRIKVTCVGGGGGTPGGGGEGIPALFGAGASGGTSSFGSYMSATGSTSSAAGSTQGASLTYTGDSAAIGAFGRGTTVSSQYGVVTGFNGGNGVKYIDAPFPQTQVPVMVGPGGGGGGGYGGIPGGGGVTSAQQINGGRGSNGGPVPGVPNTFYGPGGGGGGASGTSAQMQGTGGQAGTQIPAVGAGQPGQPGANPYQGLFGGLGGVGTTSGGTAGYQGIVIVEYF